MDPPLPLHSLICLENAAKIRLLCKEEVLQLLSKQIVPPVKRMNFQTHPPEVGKFYLVSGKITDNVPVWTLHGTERIKIGDSGLFSMVHETYKPPKPDHSDSESLNSDWEKHVYWITRMGDVKLLHYVKHRNLDDIMVTPLEDLKIDELLGTPTLARVGLLRAQARSRELTTQEVYELLHYHDSCLLEVAQPFVPEQNDPAAGLYLFRRLNEDKSSSDYRGEDSRKWKTKFTFKPKMLSGHGVLFHNRFEGKDEFDGWVRNEYFLWHLPDLVLVQFFALVGEKSQVQAPHDQSSVSSHLQLSQGVNTSIPVTPVPPSPPHDMSSVSSHVQLSQPLVSSTVSSPLPQTPTFVPSMTPPVSSRLPPLEQDLLHTHVTSPSPSLEQDLFQNPVEDLIHDVVVSTVSSISQPIQPQVQARSLTLAEDLFQDVVASTMSSTSQPIQPRVQARPHARQGRARAETRPPTFSSITIPPSITIPSQSPSIQPSPPHSPSPPRPRNKYGPYFVAFYPHYAFTGDDEFQIMAVFLYLGEVGDFVCTTSEGNTLGCNAEKHQVLTLVYITVPRSDVAKTMQIYLAVPGIPECKFNFEYRLRGE